MPARKQGNSRAIFVEQCQSNAPYCFTDAYKALELMEQYLSDLQDKPGTNDLQDALGKAIVAIRSRLFQALLGKHTVYRRVKVLSV